MEHLNISESFMDMIDKLDKLRQIIRKGESNGRLAMNIDRLIAKLIRDQLKKSSSSDAASN